jgi:hypothetical protein
MVTVDHGTLGNFAVTPQADTVCVVTVVHRDMDPPSGVLLGPHNTVVWHTDGHGCSRRKVVNRTSELSIIIRAIFKLFFGDNEDGSWVHIENA